ncbi:hypothetical protein GLYMA_02G118260v4 [Glycine max]|nr:hypothetical protein GLYMA_02G118260v4 [Glycine max]
MRLKLFSLLIPLKLTIVPCNINTLKLLIFWIIMIDLILALKIEICGLKIWWEGKLQYGRQMNLGVQNPLQLMKLGRHTGKPLPLTCTPIKFGSWMGGDRDGNPNVTAKVWDKA